MEKNSLPSTGNSKKSFQDRFEELSLRIKTQVFSLYFASRDPRTPWYAKVLAVLVVAYALSPIDLIPDFIPVLGYLDDLLIVPAGVALAVRLIPHEVMQDAREKAKKELTTEKKLAWIGVFLTILMWMVIIGVIALVVWGIAALVNR